MSIYTAWFEQVRFLNKEEEKEDGSLMTKSKAWFNIDQRVRRYIDKILGRNIMTNKMLGKGFSFKLRIKMEKLSLWTTCKVRKFSYPFVPSLDRDLQKQMLSLENNWETFSKLNTTSFLWA